MHRRRLAVSGLFLLVFGCSQPSQDEEADALNTRSAGIRERAAAAAVELDEFASEVADWRARHEISASTGELLAALLAHPYGVHTPQEQTEPDAQEYSRFEARAAGIKAEQRAIEADWSALSGDVDDWAARHSVTFEDFSFETRFAIGEPLPDGSRIALARKPCPATVLNSAGRTCHLKEEHCIRIGRQNGVILWSQVCNYRCSRSLNPFDKLKPSPIASVRRHEVLAGG